MLLQLVSVSTSAPTSLGPSQATAREIQVDHCSISTLTTGGIRIKIKWLKLTFFFISFCSRYVQIGVASFGSIVDCGSKPGGFSRMTFDVMQWIRKVKVIKKVCFEREEYCLILRLTPGSIRLRWGRRKVSGVDTKIDGIQQMQKFHMTNSFIPQRTLKIQALVLTHSQVSLFV